MSRRSTLPSPWRELALHAGGVSSLAGELGVTRLTIYRWAHGLRAPSILEQRAIASWAKHRGLEAPKFAA